MSKFSENLVKARSHIITIIGLIAAFSLAIWLEKTDLGKSDEQTFKVKITHSQNVFIHRPLTAE